MQKKNVFLVAAFCVIMAGMLCGCGLLNKKPDPLFGRYDVYAIETGGVVIAAEDFLEKESFIELKEKNKAVFAFDGEPQELKWKADDDEIVFSDSADELDGTIEDDIIALDFEGSTVYFAKGWADTSSINVAEDIFAGYESEPSNPKEPEDIENTDDADEEPVEEIAEDGRKISPTEPSGASGQYYSEEEIYRMACWTSSVDWDILDFDTIVATIGEPTEDDGNHGVNSMTEYGDHYFFWKINDTDYLYVGFRTKDGTTWKLCGKNTSGFTSEDYDGIDVSGMPGVN